MQLPTSTAEILAFKVLGRSVDKKWSAWAYEMLQAGYDTESLIELAGENAPYNQFEMERLTSRVFNELGLEYEDSELIIKNYACYLLKSALDEERSFITVLDILKDIYIELDFAKYLHDFYALYYAKEDLKYGYNQYYWPEGDRNTMDEIIVKHFHTWISQHCVLKSL